MLNAYSASGAGLAKLPDEALPDAEWIDLYLPQDEEIDRLRALGVSVPNSADMEEIEISNRLYRENETDHMIAVLPGEMPDGTRASMPVAFILSRDRLVTVRHHAPRPFTTFPTRADRSTVGCATPDRLFIGLIEEIVARLADILEGSGRVLDDTTRSVFGNGELKGQASMLQAALRSVGAEAELMARVRLGLLSVERVLAFYTAMTDKTSTVGKLRPAVRAVMRDVQALEVHADFLGARVSLTVDTTMGLINLQQNDTVRSLSVVASLFLPPTLIASAYGMNFATLPEFSARWGFPGALLLMVASSLITYLFLKWKKWL